MQQHHGGAGSGRVGSKVRFTVLVCFRVQLFTIENRDVVVGEKDYRIATSYRKGLRHTHIRAYFSRQALDRTWSDQRNCIFFYRIVAERSRPWAPGVSVSQKNGYRWWVFRWCVFVESYRNQCDLHPESRFRVYSFISSVFSNFLSRSLQHSKYHIIGLM